MVEIMLVIIMLKSVVDLHHLQPITGKFIYSYPIKNEDFRPGSGGFPTPPPLRSRPPPSFQSQPNLPSSVQKSYPPPPPPNNNFHGSSPSLNTHRSNKNNSPAPPPPPRSNKPMPPPPPSRNSAGFRNALKLC